MSINRNFELHPVGLDNGYGNVKAVCGLSKKLITFPSVVALSGKGLSGDEVNYKDETGSYLVGADAQQLTETRIRSIDSSYIKTNDYRVQALHALKQLNVKNAALVTGLPVEFFKQDKITLEKIIKGWKGKPHINAVTAVPQPMGALIDASQNWDGSLRLDISNKKVIIVDIGQGTIDVIEADNGRISRDKYNGRSEGIAKLHSDVLAFVNNKYDKVKHDLKDMDSYIQNGFFYDGEEITLPDNVLNPLRKKMADKVVDLIHETWPKGYATIPHIIFTGGGAAALRSELIGHKKPFPEKQAIITDDPASMNANGFAKLAQTLARKVSSQKYA